MNTGIPQPPDDTEHTIASLRRDSLTEMAGWFEALRGAPIAPFDADALARWAIRKYAHANDDAERFPAILAAGFVLMHVPFSERSKVTQSIAWPHDCVTYVLAARRMLSPADFEVIDRWHAGEVLAAVSKSAHAAVPDLFRGTSIVGFAIAGEAVCS